MIWIVFAAMTAAAVLCIIWPLLRPGTSRASPGSDLSFYRDTLAELEDDIARGLLPEDEARGARAELGRRLLAAADRGAAAVDRAAAIEGGGAESAAARRPRLLPALLVLGLVPVFAVALYLHVGHPARGDEPLAGRVDADRELASAVARVEAHLSQHPEDGAGFEVIAPIYLKAGRYQAAAEAYANVIRLLGDTPQRQAALGQSLVLAADGVVTTSAREAFEAALRSDPGLPQARFFLGLGALQDGDKPKARDIWTQLVANAPPNAGWVGLVKQHLAALDAPPAPSAAGEPNAEATASPPLAATIASLPPEQRTIAIRGMVDGLAARLAQNGRDPEGWLRLVRAYSVLGDTDKAKAALSDARRVLKDDGQAISRLDGLAHELGLEG